jgi:hypothetical protein
MIFTETQKPSQQLPIYVVSYAHDMGRASNYMHHSHNTHHRLQPTGTR